VSVDVQRKRAWLVHSNRWNSAITEYAISSALSLKKLEIDCIATPLRSSPAEKRFSDLGFKVMAVQGFSVANFCDLLAIGRTIEPDYVFVSGGAETFTSLLLSKLLSSKYFRLRGQPPGSARFSLDGLAHAHISKVFVPSQAVMRQLSSRVLVKARHLTLGISQDRFHRVPDLHGKGRPEIVIFGRLDPVKGHREFFEIFKIMVERWNKSELRPLIRIIGREANIHVADLKQMADAIGLHREDIEFVAEQIDDPSRIMSQATLGVIPSTGSEYICRVAEEFLMCGTPIFVSGAGALPEVTLLNSVECYGGMADETAAKKLLFFLQRVSQESEEERAQRASLAYEKFSIETMASHLQEFL
jgi:glycosyltransferase involved in cell wall biosynthesis